MSKNFMKTIISYSIPFIFIFSLAQESVSQVKDGAEKKFNSTDERRCKYQFVNDGNWTKQEIWAWQERICLGKIADMSLYEKGNTNECDADKANEWPNGRVLRSKFLELVLSHVSYQKIFLNTGVRIRCARINENFDISNIVLDQNLQIENSLFQKNFIANNLQSKSHISLIGTVIKGQFYGKDLIISGSIIMKDSAKLTDVILTDAKIGGGFSLAGSTVSGLFRADRIKVGGNFNLGAGAHFQKILIIGANIDGDLFLNGSTVDGQLNAYDLKLAGHLNMRGKARFRDVILNDAKIGSGLSMGSSKFDGNIHADRINVKDILSMNDGASFRDVRLVNAKISGVMNMATSRFDGLVNAYGIQIENDLVMGAGAYFHSVRISNAKIGGRIDASGAVISAMFNGENTEVHGGLSMQSSGHFKDVRLIGAKIGGQINLGGSKFDGLFNAQRLVVRGSVLMRDGASFKDVKMNGSRIEGSLQLRDSQFDGIFDLTAASISDELHLSSPRISVGSSKRTEMFPPPRWTEKAKFILQNTRSGALNDTIDSWEGLASGRLVLTGFIYDRMGGLRATHDSAMFSRPIDWLLCWLGKQEGLDKGYLPQPYEQLAKVLRESGYPEKARDILIAQRNYERDSPATSLSAKAILWLQWGLIGYGYRNWLAIIWLLGLSAIGTWICGMSAIGRHMRRAQRIWYSIDLALPIFELNRRHNDIKHTGAVLVYFYFHKMVGFILASFVVAGLSGLTK